MASAGPSSGGSDRRRSLDAEVNLVPFIDLLSMCICFLLMTAVWMEVGTVNIKQVVGTDGPASNVPSYEVDMKFASANKAELTIQHPDKKVERTEITGVTAEAMLADLKSKIQAFVQQLPTAETKGDVKAAAAKAVSVARVTTKAGVSYGEMVSAMDVLREQGIVNIGVMPVKE